jgi:hypothetical protein
MFRLLRRLPYLRVLAFAKLALLAWRHLRQLDAADRRRLRELARRGRSMTGPERAELRRLLGKLQPRAFAGATAAALSPVPLPRRLSGRSAR